MFPPWLDPLTQLPTLRSPCTAWSLVVRGTVSESDQGKSSSEE
jgi:hypothetical protein